jgi:hypothetical protein
MDSTEQARRRSQQHCRLTFALGGKNWIKRANKTCVNILLQSL